MPIQRAYNVWKTGTIYSIKKMKIDGRYYWCTVGFSKTHYEKFKNFLLLKIFDRFDTYPEAVEGYEELMKTVKKYKFPRGRNDKN